MTARKNQNHGVEILLAEDSPTQAEKLRHLLEGHGYTVTTARDGQEALASARRRKPTLIISDILMPELDGYGLCKAIKADEKLNGIPVILMTTLSDSRDVIRGLECGADNFIRKPYDERYLLSRVGYLLMNLELRKNQKVQMGVEINLGGHRHFITAERQQILDLLISTYEQAVDLNNDLMLREKELAASNQVLQGLYRIAEGLNQAVSERAVAEAALGRALDLPGVRAGWIFVLDGADGFVTLASRNLPPVLSAPDAFGGDCMCRRKLLGGELGSVTNILECERLGRAKGETQGWRYHASVPLSLGDRTLGVMNLVGPGEGLFGEEDMKILCGIGNQVAVALERARLHEHLEKLVEQRTAALTAEIAERKRAQANVMRLNRVYAVLSGINTAIVRIRDRQELFDEACRIAVDHGKFTFAWIGLLDADTQTVTPVAKAGSDDGYLARINLTAKEDAPDSCPLTARALTHAEPVICNDTATDDRLKTWRAEALRRGYRSIALFPLILNGRSIGVFVLYAPEAGIFDEEEVRLLVEMAGDISFALDHLEKENKLNYLAYFDPITGLSNRALFLDRVDQWIRAARHDRGAFSVMMFDLERFSVINDTLGRQTGDELLRQVAQRLKETLDEADILAHIAGNCFGIAAGYGVEGKDIAHVLERILSVIRNSPFLVDGKELRLAARAGVSSFPGDGDDVESLYRNAEAALKKAKLSKDEYQFYTPELNARVAERLTLENKLRIALEQEQLVLHYQPKIDLRSGRINGLEALLRWNDPDAGLVPPLRFIPLLEETGMIFEAGRWALAKAMSDSRAWQAKGLAVPRIAVNVSPIQLRQKDFVGAVERVLSGAGNTASQLELEITESVIMQDIEANIQKLRAIREMGVEVAIDDFGTGYSSLSYIAKLPVNALKIDRSFIVSMTSNPDDLSIVSTIISLAHSLDLRVVAEGVENQEQANLLRLLKCDEMQGYLFSPAVAAEQIEQLLRQ